MPNKSPAVREMPRLTGDHAMEAARQLCKSDLKFLCVHMLGFDMWDTCHDDLVSFLEANDKAPRKLILMPREHLKTSIITVARTIQSILINPNTTILITNQTLANAEKILYSIKEYLTDKSNLKYIFGDFVGEKWNQGEIIIKQRTVADKTPTISIASPDTVVTGQHYDEIKHDDILDDTLTATREQIIKTRNFYSKSVDLLKRPAGRMTVVGTRWDDKDLYGSIISEMGAEYSIYTTGATYDGRIDGPVIFPKKFNTDILRKLLKEKGTYSFYCQYFNQPINRDNQQFKPPVRYWGELPAEGFDFVTIDLAGEEADADFNVATAMKFSRSNQLYVKEYRRGHYNVSDLIDHLFEMMTPDPSMNWRPRVAGVEVVAYQKVFLHLLTLEMRKRKKFFNIMPINPHRDKFTRIMALQPWWEQGNILLKHGMIELEEEFDRFPRGMNDDILDTLAMAVPVVQGTRPVEAVAQPWTNLEDEMSRRTWAALDKRRKETKTVKNEIAGVGR